MTTAPCRQHNGPCLAVDSTVAAVRLKHPARRIVCLSASGLDVVRELGLEPVGSLRGGVGAHPEFYGPRLHQWEDVGPWLRPNFKKIRRLQPDLILGRQFPHRYYRRWLKAIAPVYLIGGCGYEEALLRLLDIACLTQRLAQAEAAITPLEHQLKIYRRFLQHEPRKTVLVMGGSGLNHLVNRFPIETVSGTFGSVLQQFTYYPWAKPDPARGEPGLTYLSVQQIARVDPDVILVQSFAPGRQPLSQQFRHNRAWNQLRAVQTGQVYEIDPFWHWGNGTQVIRLMLAKVLPLIYPLCVAPAFLRPGLRQRDLCEHMELDYREVARTAQALGLSTHAYLQQQTGWHLKGERYYPPEPICP